MANKTKKEKLLDDLRIKNSDNVVFMKESELYTVNDISIVGSDCSNEWIMPTKSYKVMAFQGKGILGLNEELSQFKGEIVEVISFKDEFGKFVLTALCLV